MISKLDLDMPDEKGVSKRRHLTKVVEDTKGKMIPPELENEVVPEFWDEPIFNQFFEIYQRGQEFYQTIYYFQKVTGVEYGGEDLNILKVLWDTANKYLADLDRKKNPNNRKSGGKKPPPKKPHRRR